MDTPDLDNPEEIKRQFYHLAKGADFDRMGPWLIHIMNSKQDIDIPKAHLKEAFEHTITYRLNDGKIEKALEYMIRSFGVDGIDDEQRLQYANQLYNFLDENEEHLVSLDYYEIVKHLRQQINYLQVYSDNESLIAKLQSIEARLRFKQTKSADREEGPLREFISGLMNLYYQQLPDIEALDYASQIILHSKP